MDTKYYLGLAENRLLRRKDLEGLPTLMKGHFDDLKLETEEYRFWLSRMSVEDGMPYEDAITIEKLIDGKWVEVCQIPG
ncbi:MAG: hypothetical protein AMK69_11070 [Nitrospira bacterium SG8_3]|nr:MAG: hypothetical protein AMK69_11070 [Nitrospira bacterium SG8_3]